MATERRSRSLRTPLQFGTKAETLQRVAPHLRSALVLDLVHFTVEQWRRERRRCLRRISGRLGSAALVVRSSALAEDGARLSMAGAFESILGVPGGDEATLTVAIDRVVASLTGNPRDQILVQPMLADVAVSGVILTHDLVHGAPYYVINFDDETGRTDAVTAGRGVHKALRVYRHAAPEFIQSPRVARFLALARELERLCGELPLDIEFALTGAGALVLLQVRRIASTRAWHPVTERRVSRHLVFVENFVRECGAPRPGLYGARTILAVMPDWNPAEIIGTTPRPLAASLYRELVTRDVSREARAAMGYRRLPPEELMVVVNSHPYVDVRASFNSFLPAGVDPASGEPLVNAWLDRLDAQPELHDKVEFEIAHTCLDFDFDRSFRNRYAGLLRPRARADYRARLQALTHGFLRKEGSLTGAESLVQGRETSRSPDGERTADAFEALRRAVRLVRDGARSGTFAFAVIARHAFVAEALLRSAQRRGALSPERVAAFRRSVTTVTSGMLRDHAAVCAGHAPRDVFLQRYGHLRPGTYDITSPRYDARDDLFVAALPVVPDVTAERFALRPQENRDMRALLAEAGFDDITPAALLAYARRAIAGREHAKFVFTRDLSDALEALAARSGGGVNLFGAIACIENADPGFDWVFTRGIQALVTKFGGANSHMAIRCAELGLPAAIGCGEQTYARLLAAGMAEINAAARMLRPTREVAAA